MEMVIKTKEIAEESRVFYLTTRVKMAYKLRCSLKKYHLYEDDQGLEKN